MLKHASFFKRNKKILREIQIQTNESSNGECGKTCKSDLEQFKVKIKTNTWSEEDFASLANCSI